MADELLRVRDTRSPGHCWADNELIAVYGPTLGPYGISVYMVFSLVARNHTGECRITLRQIAKLLAISPSRVLKSVEQLISLGLVSQESKSDGDGPSIYTLMSVDKLTKIQVSTFFATLNPVRVENRPPCSCGSEPCSCGEQGLPDPVRVENTNNTNKTDKTKTLFDQESNGPVSDSSKEDKWKEMPRFADVVDVVNRLTKNPWEREKLPRIWCYYCERTERGAGYMPTPFRLRKGLDRLRDAVKWAQGDQFRALKAYQMAIDNLASDEFLSGKNDRNKEYRDFVDHLCKTWETFEKRLRA